MEECLYDLQQDPWELKNLVTDPASRQIKEGLRALLLEKIAASGEKAPVILPLGAAEQARRWLGGKCTPPQRGFGGGPRAGGEQAAK